MIFIYFATAPFSSFRWPRAPRVLPHCYLRSRGYRRRYSLAHHIHQSICARQFIYQLRICCRNKFRCDRRQYAAQDFTDLRIFVQRQNVVHFRGNIAFLFESEFFFKDVSQLCCNFPVAENDIFVDHSFNRQQSSFCIRERSVCAGKTGSRNKYICFFRCLPAASPAKII